MRDIEKNRDGICWVAPNYTHRRSADFVCRFFTDRTTGNMTNCQDFYKDYKKTSCEQCVYWTSFNEDLDNG